MSLNFSIANVVYVKNLSSDITEENIREKFGSCDEIISITFKNFPGLNQKYCQIEFKTSEGITNASRLNGETLLNVPMVVSVIEPIIHNTNLSELSTTECDKNVNSLLDVRNSITNQGVQTLLLQKQVISEQKKRLVDFQNSLNEKNNKFDVFSKIVYMENIPEKYGEEDIKGFFQNIGNTTSYKLQYNEQKKVHTAFVEFKNEEHAKAALNLSGTKVGLHEICIRDAYSLINDKDILKNNFSFYSNNTTGENSSNNIVNTNTIMNSTNNLAIINNMNNINNNNKFLLTTNPNVNQKVEKVLALKEKLAMKLCAMYNPNMLLVNNLVQATNPYLFNVNNTENANIQQINLETTNSIQEEKHNDTQNDKTKKEKEKEKERDKERDKDKKKKKKDNNSIDNSSYDRYPERKKSDYIKIKKYKHKNSTSSKYSYSSYSEEKTSSRNYSRSNTSSNKHKRNSISYDRREKKYLCDKNKKRKRSYNYSKSNSSYSNSKSNSRSSYESDYHRYKSSYRHRKRTKRKRSHKYTTSSSPSNSSYSERRRSRRDSDANKPWWVKESEKMKMRQKIKEKKMREMAIREKNRR
ncbi:RNA-binding protein, putative [Plasmodium reichenowi]|uniref:Negative elongation factor E n=1 Tax=Plasmodium reichenowi TaxID=5854 RepID=A0A2P9D8M2_PLARE|nr:RNA-binding protein, putative [Plasmodium reichenowi]